MPQASRTIPFDSPVPIQARLRAQWVRFREGDTYAWVKAINQNDIVLARALWSLGVSASDLRCHTLMRSVGGAGLPPVNPQILDLALRSGANPNAQESNNFWDRPLHRAVVQGRVDKTRVLLENGADPNSMDGNQYTPLATALVGFGQDPVVFKHRQPLVSLLLEAGADPKKRGRRNKDSMLSMVPMDNPELCLKTLGELIYHGADPMQAGVALAQGDTHGVGNETALLFRATEIHDVDFLTRFLEFMERHGQGPSTRGSKGQTLAHELIKAWGPIPGKNGEQTRVFYELALDILHKRGHDLKAKDKNGNTLWHSWASGTTVFPFPWTSEALISHTETREISHEKNHEGLTPLDILKKRPSWDEFNEVSKRVMAQLTQTQMDLDICAAPAQDGEKTFRSRSRL